MDQEKLITESKSLREFLHDDIAVEDRKNIEVIHCIKCGHSQVISKEPLNRLPRKYRHYRLDDNNAVALKRFALPYGSINNAIGILLHNAKESGL